MNEKDLSITPLLDLYGSLLTQRQRSIMECYYFDDLSLSEIADNNGTTRQCVHNIIRRATLQLQKYEQSLSLRTINNNLLQIAEIAKTLPKETADKILKLTEI